MSFFKLVRALTKPLVLMAEKMFKPSPIIREPMVQQRIDRETANMALYEYRACPFCMLTRRALYRLSLRIELRDALRNEQYKKELVEQGGKNQVPCLRITSDDGKETWMYESADIISYLDDRYGQRTP
jgi:glutaredoxin